MYSPRALILNPFQQGIYNKARFPSTCSRINHNAATEPVFIIIINSIRNPFPMFSAFITPIIFLNKASYICSDVIIVSTIFFDYRPLYWSRYTLLYTLTARVLVSCFSAA